jgi:hypothetical protein
MPTRASYDRVHLDPADVVAVGRVLDVYGRRAECIAKALFDISRYDSQVSTGAMTLLRWHLARAYEREEKARMAEWRPMR